MAGLGNVMPSLAKIANGGHGILDLIFRDNALIMSDSQILAGFSSFNYKGIEFSVPLPIVGFSFETPKNLNLLKYNYTEYPMINKTMVVNSFIKDMGTISVSGLRPLTRGNNVVLNYSTNQALVKLIEKYCDAGGLWSLNTMWGLYGNLVLTSLSGEETNGLGGIKFNFEFKRVNFDKIFSSKNLVGQLINKFMS